MHLRVTLFVLVLGGAGRCDQCGVHGCACFEQQALCCQQFIDGGQNLIGQFVPFQPVAKAQDGALIGHSCMGIELGKLAVDRGVKESFLHAQIRQVEPLLHAMDAQHGLQCKGRAAILAFWVIRGNKVDQGSPGNHQLHLSQQLLLAGSLGDQVRGKTALLPSLRAMPWAADVHQTRGKILQDMFLRPGIKSQPRS